MEVLELLNQAVRCRRLSRDMPPGPDAVRIAALADEFEARARAAEPASFGVPAAD